MDFGRLERIYEEQFIDRNWWGCFPQAEAVVRKDFPVSRLTDLVAVCVRIARHMTGEIPRMVLSNKAPNLAINPEKITLNIKLLRLNLPEEIKVNALFGCFIHELGHLIYTRKEIREQGEKAYPPLQNSLLHMIEDRRTESKLVADFPGYHYFLYTARRLLLAMGWAIAEQRVGYYGGQTPYGVQMQEEDGTEALCHYICSKILFPNILEDHSFVKDMMSFPSNREKAKKIDRLLNPLENYAGLSFRQVEALSEDLAYIVGSRELTYENFFLKEMKDVLKNVENYAAGQEIRLAESVIREMQKTLNPEESFFYTYLKTAASKEEHSQVAEKQFVPAIREVTAEHGNIRDHLLNQVQEFAAGLRLQLSMFSAKLDKNRILYEQDTGELDEDDLYQSRFNRNVFWEEEIIPAPQLEVVTLCDLSGSMVTGDKIAMQITVAAGLALAFERYTNIVRYAVYGHRCDDNGIEITCFHKAGSRLQLEKLFSQKAAHANADGYAMEYCFGKFRKDSGHKLLLMISDGNPSVVGYEGEDAKEHVRDVVDKGKREHIEVLSIGIGNLDQADMYDQFIPFSGSETAEKLSRWLKKKFMNYADEALF